MTMQKQVDFDGGALTFLGTKLLGIIVTLFSLGICFPWAICMHYNWEIKHTIIEGRRMKFHGSAFGLFGTWIKWWIFIILTMGIYGFWVYPSLKRWIAHNTTVEA